jgi:hypothetical protein
MWLPPKVRWNPHGVLAALLASWSGLSISLVRRGRRRSLGRERSKRRGIDTSAAPPSARRAVHYAGYVGYGGARIWVSATHLMICGDPGAVRASLGSDADMAGMRLTDIGTIERCGLLVRWGLRVGDRDGHVLQLWSRHTPKLIAQLQAKAPHARVVQRHRQWWWRDDLPAFFGPS